MKKPIASETPPIFASLCSSLLGGIIVRISESEFFLASNCPSASDSTEKNRV